MSTFPADGFNCEVRAKWKGEIVYTQTETWESVIDAVLTIGGFYGYKLVTIKTECISKTGGTRLSVSFGNHHRGQLEANINLDFACSSDATLFASHLIQAAQKAGYVIEDNDNA